MLALGKALGHQLFQGFQILPVLRGDRHDLGIRQLLGQPAQVRQQLGLVLDAVGLVDGDDQRSGDVLHALQHGPSSSVQRVRSTTKITTSTSFSAEAAVRFM